MKVKVRPFTETQIDRIISDRFAVSLMSDSKWDRLVDRLTDAFDRAIHVRYKLIDSDEVRQTTFIMADFKPFFVEPIFYREVEWIEFPHSYEDLVSRNNRKAGTKAYDQDVPAIQCEIERLGKFALEHVPTGLRLYAYK